MWQNNENDKVKNHLHMEAFVLMSNEVQITYNTKKTIQPNNKAPRRSPSFGSIVSFVTTVPEKRPNLGMGKLGYTGLSLRAGDFPGATNEHDLKPLKL